MSSPSSSAAASVDHSSESGSNCSSNGNSSQILSGKYLERHSNKKDLIVRLRNIVLLLRQDESIEAENTIDYPGLASLCQALVNILDHRDKLVRLYTVSACMELFAIYVPDAPWDTASTLEIFRQTIRQLANLAHTTQPSQTHFSEYWRILELLASVKIGVLLVELNKEGGEFADEALQVLSELFRTVLQSVRLEHPPEIPELAQATIQGCLEEYYEGILLPVPLLDELLVCVGQGPTVLVTNPQKALERKSKKKLPPHQVEQTNPSYMVASSVIRKTVDRLSTPIATLLNGLLNNDTRMVSESSILTHAQKNMAQPQPQNQELTADVWSIIYELHKIAPSILTTVIGTLANFLSDPQVNQRMLVVKLLGRLFVKSSKLSLQFRPCFREWLARIQDVNVEIRLAMVNYLLQLIPNETEEISQEAQPMLQKALDDPSSETRLKAIHGLCDLAYRHRTRVSLPLWTALATRVSSKHRQERKDALTGLAQTYYKQFMVYHLRDVQAGGDDCPLEVVQNTLDAAQKDDERYHWIPSKVFEGACLKDDAELQSRILQLMDDLLLGSELPQSSKKFTATARTVGLAVLLDSLQPNAQAWMKQLWNQRAKLQHALGEYLEARSKIKEYPSGTEEAFTANAKALDLLEKVASWTPLSTTPGERHPTLEQFHTAKDKHIFRILSTIANPAHTPKARVRALEELPKRVKSLGDGVLTWVKGLVRRCAMGDFLNTEIVHHAILLAQECWHAEDYESCQKFLKPVRLASETFPQLCATQDSFSNLVELFAECRSVKQNTDQITTTLSSILAKAAPNTGESWTMDDSLQKQLLNLCCRDGTPEQARHAVSTMAALLQHGSLTQEQTDVFSPLLKSLASPSRLSISPNNKSTKIVSVLVALAELAECAPKVLASARGKKAVQFALEMVLLGRGHENDETKDGAGSDEENTNPNESVETPQRRRRKTNKRQSRDRKHSSPGRNESIFEDANLSVSCRTLCAAIEFLVSYVRSSILASRASPRLSTSSQDSSDSNPSTPLQPPSDLIESLFDILSRILRDDGMPPSSHDRKECRLRQERAALRQSAAIHLLRLCDSRLGLERSHLTPARWHNLSTAFLDDERVVRDKMMEELGLLLTGNGKYKKSPGTGMAMAPKLRFLAFVVLCTDGDHGADHSVANGNAANVGKRSSNTKSNATGCITFLRKAYEVTAAQARADGPEAEKRFETQMKVMVMPEYVVPYAFHLLAFRRETPSAGGASYAKSTGLTQSSKDDENYEVDEGQHRVLKKRLKWLFDPLVSSLGDTADNISFLLRMTEVMGKYYQPVGIVAKRARQVSLGLDSDSENDGTEPSQDDDCEMESAKLKIVCAAAREVLLSYVKKDVNLATYPGSMQLPGNLFRRRVVTKKRRSGPAERSTKIADQRTSQSSHDRSDRVRDKSMENQPDSSKESIPASLSQVSDLNESPSSGTRRSGRLSQSTLDAESLAGNDSIGLRSRRSQRSSRSVGSSSIQNAATNNNGVKKSQTSRRTPDPKSLVSDNAHVHFSPELSVRNIPREPADFGDLSPINAKVSPGGDKSILLSSSEKTRGTTPPSAVRNTRFTASASLAFTGATVSAESPSSKVSEAKSANRSGNSDSMVMDNEADTSRTTRSTRSSSSKKRPSPEKEEGSKKRRKGSVPSQVMIVRHKSRNDSASSTKSAGRATRSRSRKSASMDDDNLDFDGGSKNESNKRPKKTVRRGKENSAPSKKKTPAPSKRTVRVRRFGVK